MENDFCDRSFRVGEIVMNENTIESEERVIQVHRGNKLLENPSSYYPKEMLKVSLSIASGDIIFQVENATFVNGGCQGRRTCKNQQSLLLPIEPVGVKIWAGWAGEHGVVRITKDFILYPLPLATGALEPMSIPREPQLNIDTEYLKARNSQVLERRKQKPQEEEENIFEEPEEELAPDVELAEEEEELEEEILPAITAAGMKHLDTMTVHLRGVVHENVPSEFHDLFYLFLALSGLLILYLVMAGIWKCSCRFFGLSSSGKWE